MITVDSLVNFTRDEIEKLKPHIIQKYLVSKSVDDSKSA
jgi:hypothetical protein